MHASCRKHVLAAVALAILAVARPAYGEDPPLVVRRIDSMIQKALDEARVPASPQTDDAEFLRRAYLDITGRIPTFEQTTAFLASKAQDRRAQLIDELLARPEYGLHFATIWRDLIVDRSMEQSQVRQGFSWEFITWLAEALNQERGWNAIVADMITAEGEAKKNPAATFILANRVGTFPNPADIVGMAGKLFMGTQLRCAQCHDHPYVGEWHQDDFWGLAAFFVEVRDHNMGGDGNSQNPAFFEKPNPDPKKEISYVNRMKRQGLLPAPAPGQIALPRLGEPPVMERAIAARYFLGAAPAVKAEEPLRPRLAAWLTAADNPYFARAAVNRLWAHFFARGLIHPIDDLRPDKEASHPELLDLLEKEFKASGFNCKHLIRCICNSQAYQRTSKPLPANAGDDRLFSHMAIKVLSADQMIDAVAIAGGRAPTAGKNRDQQTAPFATKGADADPTELAHGIPQYLFQMNAGPVNAGSTILGRLVTGKSREEAIEGIYLAVLSRPPRPAEIQRTTAYLGQAADPQQGYRDIHWVLLNSAEFWFNR